MAYDPICGKKVQPVQQTPSAQYKQRTYYFCSDGCKDDFSKAAERVRLHEAAKAGALLSHGKVRWGLA